MEVLAIVSMLSAIEGSLVRTIAFVGSSFRFDISIASPECLLPRNAPTTPIVYAVMVLTPGAVWLFLEACKFRHRNNAKKADAHANRCAQPRDPRASAPPSPLWWRRLAP